MSDLSKLIDAIREVLRDHVWDGSATDVFAHTDERIIEAATMHRAVRRIDAFLDLLPGALETAKPTAVVPTPPTAEDWARVLR